MTPEHPQDGGIVWDAASGTGRIPRSLLDGRPHHVAWTVHRIYIDGAVINEPPPSIVEDEQ